LLENAKVLLLNANATGCETLKNLVLPGTAQPSIMFLFNLYFLGIGSFTVVDGKKVDAGDLGTNFFVTLKSVGESRARVTTELLEELNEYVKGHHVEEV
jgi:NEDD8-activating enzyme E1 regulatory subunit